MSFARSTSTLVFNTVPPSPRIVCMRCITPSARKGRAVANRRAAKMATTSVRGVPRCSRTIRCRRHGTCDEGSTRSPEAKKGRCASREDVAGSRKDARSLSRAEANAEEAQAQDEHRRPVGKEHDRGQQYSPEAAFAQDKVVQT